MTPRRLYQKRGRWYADLRDFSSVGGGLEALKVPGTRSATTDEPQAWGLLAGRLRALQDLQEDHGDAVCDGTTDFETYAGHHLELKARARATSTIERDEFALLRILDYAESRAQGPTLVDVNRVPFLNDYIAHRQGCGMAPQTIRNELNALSSLLKTARSEGLIQENAVQLLPFKPNGKGQERVWLEIDEAGRLLGAANGRRALLAFYLLTGARKVEGLRTRVADIDFERGHVWINGVKNSGRRWVPLWPQLEEILLGWIEARSLSPEDLLFDVVDFRSGLLVDLKRAGIKKHVTPHTLRHTYTAARLQTLDEGAPVSVYTVARELGHRSLRMLEDVYGHRLETRGREEVVCYPILAPEIFSL